MNNITTKLGIIYDGWKNYIFPNEEVEKVAKERANECAECEHMRELGFDLGLVFNNKFFKYWGCDLCKCPIGKKIRSMKETNKCDDNRW